MWEIPQEILRVGLPEGFSLAEEEHFINLFHNGENIASFFSTAAHPEIIRAVAEAYNDRIKPQQI
jgi:hypothetical protein